MWACTPEILSENFVGIYTRLLGALLYQISHNAHVHIWADQWGNARHILVLHGSIGAVFIDSLLSALRKTTNQSTNQLSTEKMLSVNSSDERAQTVVIDSSVSCEWDEPSWPRQACKLAGLANKNNENWLLRNQLTVTGIWHIAKVSNGYAIVLPVGLVPIHIVTES